DRKLMSSSVNQFLLNLAIADLGNLIFCSPDAILVLIDRGWLLPNFACHLLRFLQEYFLYASVLLQASFFLLEKTRTRYS
ncbi:G-protein coupled receptor, partial [Salmonella sp. hn-f5]|nr:G-protein coupled receptor [Salmonella sp. hn-f5]